MRFWNFLPLLAMATCGGAHGSKIGEPATVFVHGRVYTMEPSAAPAEAVVIGGGRILYVGTNAEALRRGGGARVVDLGGKMVLPGFHDSHVHPVTGGIELAEANLNDAWTIEEVKKRLLAYAAEHPGDGWITGGGWPLPLFKDANPSKALLDEWFPNRPVYLTAFDGHSAWVNSRALAMSGIDRKTPDPEHGRIERDTAGNPSGTLREDAKRLVKTPVNTPADYLAGLVRGQEMAHRFGITSWIDASVDAEILAAYRTLEQRGELTGRVTIAYEADLARGPEQIAEIAAVKQSLAGSKIRLTSAKIFADGVIESKTAAVLQPYLGGTDRGILNAEPAVLTALVVALDAAGLDVHIHAIGDRAIRESLNAFEAARNKNGVRDARHAMAHIELIDPADIPRFAALGVIANFQALWAYADPYLRELTFPILDKERWPSIYPINSVRKTGAHIAGGSDWSVSSMNPLDAIQVAVTRQGLDSKEAVFLPDERVPLATMLAAYTVEGAYAARTEAVSGTLAVGKVADLVVLDKDLFEVAPADIHKVSVIMTVVGGVTVYQRE